MKKKIVLSAFLLFSIGTVLSQSPALMIQGSTGKFYLVHTVVAKENWYSIGRLFNCPPHDIAAFNNLNFDKPLEINQVINIPLTTGNFDQKKQKETGETLVPVYHVVDDKEWIYKLSSIYNDVPVTNLEKWNNIKKDDVKKGMQLIVGFLKVKTDQSPLAIGLSSNPVLANSNPAVTTEAAKTTTPSTVAGSAKLVPDANPPGTPQPMSNSAIQVSNPSERVNNYAATHSNGGFFSVDYAGGAKTASGMAGTFKSTSGWTDGKYYALMNSVPVGTIVRVNGNNGKTIYAKVLGQLPEMKESNGLLIRISNAASAELGLGEGKFSVDVKY